MLKHSIWVLKILEGLEALNLVSKFFPEPWTTRFGCWIFLGSAETLSLSSEFFPEVFKDSIWFLNISQESWTTQYDFWIFPGSPEVLSLSSKFFGGAEAFSLVYEFFLGSPEAINLSYLFFKRVQKHSDWVLNFLRGSKSAQFEFWILRGSRRSEFGFSIFATSPEALSLVSEFFSGVLKHSIWFLNFSRKS